MVLGLTPLEASTLVIVALAASVAGVLLRQFERRRIAATPGDPALASEPVAVAGPAKESHGIPQASGRVAPEDAPLLLSRPSLPDVPAALAIVDRAARLLAANPAWCNWLGVPLDTVTTLHLSEFVHANAHSQLAALLHPDIGRTASRQAELRMVDRDGRRIQAAVTADLSTAAWVTLSFFDLTAIRQAQQSLAHRERRYRNLVEDQTDLVSLATIDGVLTFANHAYARHFGLSTSEMLGRSLYDFIPEDERPSVRRHLRGVLESGKVVRSPNRLVNADGRAVWFQWVNRVLPDADGRMTVLHSVGRDITERMQAESAMRLLNQEQSAILDNDLIGIAKIRDRQFVWVSQGLTRMLGYADGELLGTPTRRLYADEEAWTRYGNEGYPEVRAGRRYHAEFAAVRGDGSEMWLAASAMMFDAAADVLLCVYTDVTAQKRAELALRASLAQEARQRSELASLRDAAEGENELAKFLLRKLAHVEYLGDHGVAYHWAPATTFSGDLVAVATSGAGDLYGMLADASGHGLAAAINLIPLSSAFYAMAAKGFNLATISDQLNRVVKEYSLPDRFVAVTLARIQVREKLLELVNAGNPPALLLDRDGHVLRELGSGSVPFGILAHGAFHARVEQLELSGEEQLLLYSDGVVESAAPDGGHFGRARLEAAVRNCRNATARVEAVRVALEAHADGSPRLDDVSLLLLGVPSAITLGETRGQPATVQDDAAGGRRRADWSLTLSLSARELKTLEAVPVIAELATNLGLEGTPGARVFTVLSELFVNALEHGLLGLGSHLKEGPGGFDRYLALRAERLQALDAGHVDVTLRHVVEGDSARITIIVEDSGPGFDHQAQQRAMAVDMCDAAALLSYGRGLPLLHTLCDQVTYEGNGNRVIACFSYR